MGGFLLDGSGVFLLEPARVPGQLWLSAVVDLDFAVEDEALAELRAALEQGDCAECVVDASEVFVDVRGLSVLLEAAELAKSRDCAFLVAGPASLYTMYQALGIADGLQMLDPRIVRLRSETSAHVSWRPFRSSVVSAG